MEPEWLKLWSMGTTQSVRSWLHKSNPENSREVVAAHACNPSDGEAQTGGSPRLTGWSVHEIQAKETPCLREMDGIPGDASSDYPLATIPPPFISSFLSSKQTSNIGTCISKSSEWNQTASWRENPQTHRYGTCVREIRGRGCVALHSV